MDESFVVYRPPRPAHRLENIYAAEKPGVWKPSHSYKQKLVDIQNQFTPSEYFRHRLATSGKQIRLIQRLELRINRNVDGFHRAAVKIQAIVRGLLARMHFNRVRRDLEVSLELRRHTQHAVEAFHLRHFYDCILHCKACSTLSEQIYSMQLRSHYHLEQYKEAIECCKALKSLNNTLEDVYYIQACCLCRLDDLPQAMQVLDEAYAFVAKTSAVFLRLYAYVCLQLQPARCDSAIESFTEIIKRNSKDFDAHLERASVYCCLQEYSLALKDLKVILAFKPDYHLAKLRRARLYTCMRNWQGAKDDYAALQNTKYKQEANAGLQEIEIAQTNALMHA